MANPLAGNFSSTPTFDTDEEPPSKKNGKQNGNGDAVELEGLKDQEKVQALERQLALTTRKVEDKEKFIVNLTAAGERGVLEAFQAQIKRQEDELQTIRKVLWVQSKTKPAKKHRDQLSKAREELGAEKPIHKSPNTLRTLRDFQRNHTHARSLQKIKTKRKDIATAESPCARKPFHKLASLASTD